MKRRKEAKITITKNEVIAKALMDIHGEAEWEIVTPSELVAYAEPENSPIHKYFEWDNEKAGHQHRLWQARQLIATVRVTLEDKPFDGYYNVKVQLDEKLVQGYFSAKTVASKEVLQKQLLKSALDELRYWRKKYDEIVELSHIFEAVDLEIERLTKGLNLDASL